MIIAITGFATSGKDTFFKLLAEDNPKHIRVAFADELKKTAAPYIKSLYNIDIFNCTPEDKEIARPILIAIGCWARDNISDTYWVDKTIEQIRKLIHQGYIPTICDFRFKSEIVRLQQEFGEQNVIGVEIIRTDSEYIPPQKEIENRPFLIDYIDYTVEWPTVTTLDKKELFKYIEEFKEWNSSVKNN